MVLLIIAALASEATAPDNPAVMAGRAWNACLIQSARKFASSAESASVIAEAVMSDCATIEQQVKQRVFALQLRANQHLPGGVSDLVANAETATDRAMEDMRRQMRGEVIGIVLEERAKPTGQSPSR